MDPRHWLYFSFGFATAAVLTFVACRRWYSRQVMAVERRLLQIDQARLFANQRGAQARRQVETLQTSLALRSRTAQAVSGSFKPPAACGPAADEASSATQRADGLDAVFADEQAREEALWKNLPKTSPTGFADTQIMA